MEMLVLQVILPLVINVLAGIFLTSFIKLRRSIVVTLIIIFLALGSCLYYAYIQTPELVVVPNLKHHWVDEAKVLCKKIGLRVEVKAGNYGDRQNEVQRQSLEPGSLVSTNSAIEISVCRGSPSGDPLYNYPQGQIAQVTDKGVNK
jgi:hypothetical protein